MIIVIFMYTMVVDDKYIFLTQNHNGYKYSEKWLNKNHKWVLDELVKYVNDNNLDDLIFKQKLYCTITNSSPKKCYCGNNATFISINEGYGTFCSNKCSSNSIEKLTRYKETNIEKYGVEYYTQTKEYMDKVKKTNLEKYGAEHVVQSGLVKEKIKKTNLEKYGVENIGKSEHVKEKIKKTKKIKYGNESYNNPNKIKKTLLNKYNNVDHLKSFLEKQYNTNNDKYGVSIANRNEGIKKTNVEKTLKAIKEKYGVDNPFQSEVIKEKIKKTNLEKYGVDNYSKSKQHKQHIKEKNINKLLVKIPKGYSVIDSDEHNLFMTCDKGHEFNLNRQLFFIRCRAEHDVCCICNPLTKHVSYGEKKILEYVKSLSCGIIENDRKILNNKELDVYIPSHNLAIEHNGLYWHSELYYDKNYHLNKTIECQKKDIKLLHVFEDEWVDKGFIVKSIIKNQLGLIDNKIHGRKCSIKQITTEESRKFLNENHIQGYVNSSVKLGLYYNNELVSVMTFGSLRKALGSKSKEGDYEMLRFCNKLNTNVIGGASKLFKYFINNYNFEKIISYSDRRYFDGSLYEKLGFNFVHNTEPNYYYINNGKRENRFKYRKDILVKEGHNPNKTEHEIMLDRGIYRIYDCGNKKWVYEKR